MGETYLIYHIYVYTHFYTLYLYTIYTLYTAKLCQPTQLNNIQSLKEPEARLIHPLGLATQDHGDLSTRDWRG